MNYLGHKSTAVLLFPLILFPIQKIDSTTDIPLLDKGLFYLKDVSQHFIEVSISTPWVFFASIIMYWIGSTLIDTIDFKIIKRFMPRDKQSMPYYYHRQWTHGFIDNLILLLLSFYLLQYSDLYFIFLFYMLGVWTHLIVDMFSGSIPIFFYGNYAKSMSRIGINRIVPASIQPFFSKSFPKLYDRISPVLFIFGTFLFFYFDGMNILVKPVFVNLFN